MTYPDTVSFDMRFTVPAYRLPWLVKYLESIGEQHRVGVDIIVPDTLPYGDVTDLLGD